ncbi:ultraviolet-B receptor UVR8 isoform X6 [Cryptomeria japonica]|uniref:ultraviolet-B receptor UVR8 isoform X6 n=1 Tax=Cryptomeria japonica TaxID=3369 RepID=UPI0025ABE102|nr:ultraviolet-B receptor UVR8 isoform X6 [Cryptomeria japonica]
MLRKEEGTGGENNSNCNSSSTNISNSVGIFMWGYLPAISQRVPLLSPTPVPRSTTQEPWKEVCSGGCGFALALSESGKLNTWGSTDDLGQSYVTSGKHEENPEPFPLQTEAAIVQAAAGWAHCIAVTDRGEVYTWGWKECVPTGKTTADQVLTGAPSTEKDMLGSQVESSTDQGDCGLLVRPSFNDQYECHYSCPSTSSEVSQKSKNDPTTSGTRGKFAASGLLQSDRMVADSSASMKSHLSRSSPRVPSNVGLTTHDQSGDDGAKRRRLAAAKQVTLPESSTAGGDAVSAPLCLVTLRPGEKIVTVAAGGRHTLALSDTGQVWGWGYGGEGQLGLGSRIRTVSSPHLVPCIDTASHWQGAHQAGPKGSRMSEGQTIKAPGNYVKAIACGGRHSAVITDAGALLTFGWGLYGQCGQGFTEDELSPTYVSSLGGLQVQAVAAGLWHTICITATGDVYAFGGNQFGQLGTGGEQAEMFPRLLEASSLENQHAKIISCGARHSAISTENGKVFSWGWNKYGQLGLGDAIDRNIPCEGRKMLEVLFAPVSTQKHLYDQYKNMWLPDLPCQARFYSGNLIGNPSEAGLDC